MTYRGDWEGVPSAGSRDVSGKQIAGHAMSEKRICMFHSFDTLESLRLVLSKTSTGVEHVERRAMGI